MKKLPVILAFLLMTGCAGSPYRVSLMDAQEIKTVPNHELIGALENKYYRNQIIFMEAVRRDMLTHEEVKLIKNKVIRRGMRVEVLVYSWGRPDKINRFVGMLGERQQFVYGFYSISEPTYVYVKNGVVTDWED